MNRIPLARTALVALGPRFAVTAVGGGKLCFTTTSGTGVGSSISSVAAAGTGGESVGMSDLA